MLNLNDYIAYDLMDDCDFPAEIIMTNERLSFFIKDKDLVIKVSSKEELDILANTSNSADFNNLLDKTRKSTKQEKFYLEELKNEEIRPILVKSKNFRSKNNDFDKVISAPIVLKGKVKAELTIFKYLNKEHYLVKIGNPKLPIVRIHSSCFTGDVFGSMRCDCGYQLDTAISYIDKNGGGYIIYLMQEGRSIGLINKLRCYNLQEEGFDTVEANMLIGFKDDERDFTPAINMLKNEKIDQIKLISNNPRKSKIFKDNDIKVIDIIAIQPGVNSYNNKYLKTKSKKLGHKIKRNLFHKFYYFITHLFSR